MCTEKSHSLQQPYTVFKARQRRFFTYLLGYLTLASSLTATIYFPLIDLLSRQYNVSIQLINLAITIYVILQAISPAFWAPVSDILGRRPVFLMTFAIYTCASLGLALNKSSYAALLLLRALQSIGGSAVMSLAYGVVADISPRSERGKILGPMLTSTNLGPCIGPVIGGGAILASGNAMWCFWALLIFGSTAFLFIGWSLSETARTVVGNGAVRPQGIWRTWWSLLRERIAKSDNQITANDGTTTQGDINDGKTGRGKWIIPNPFISLKIIFHWDTFLILWMAASPYAVWYCIQTSIPLIFADIYGYNDLFVGLCFLPGGVGVILGGLIAGRLMDWNYKHTAREIGLEDSDHGTDTNQFPFERARSRGSFTILLVSIGLVVGYGWAVHLKANPSIPLILQALIGAKCTVLLQYFSALLVDIFPEGPGAAAAANNITRCALSGAAVAALQPLSETIGRSWMFTLIALLDGGTGLLAVYTLRRWGPTWRRKRDLASND